MRLEEVYTDWDGTIVDSKEVFLEPGQVFRNNAEPLLPGYAPIYEARLNGIRGWVLESLVKV
jgi:hypothetical protein